MIRILSASLLAAVALTGCLKAKDTGCKFRECDVVAPASEITALQTYLTNNNITAIQHCSGAFYQVMSQGTGATPDGCSTVSVSYSGYLTNGTRFDSSASATFPLGDVIRGWTALIPKVNAGGKIRLFIPPTLAYGSTARRDANGNVVIPANSNLVFNITVNSVQ